MNDRLFPDRVNNFNFIRIVAAFEVFFRHGIAHLNIESNPFNVFFSKFWGIFPGVTVFFILSGMLVYWSYERSNSLTQYLKNRLLRIYPALWISVLLCFILLIICYHGNVLKLILAPETYIWLVGQLSIFQFYTPDILRFWGVGTPNGSLWTIVVSVQFYLITPIIFNLINKNKIWLFVLLILSIIYRFSVKQLDPETVITKLLELFIFNWLYLFILGTICFVYWKELFKFFKNTFVIWLVLYLTYYHFVNPWLSDYVSITVTRVINDFFILTCVMSLGYSLLFINESKFGELLKRFDLSFGFYVFHMLVINMFVYFSYTEKFEYLVYAFIANLIISVLSWVYVEKPALKLKKKTFKIFRVTF